MKRRAQDVIADRRRELSQCSIATFALQFGSILPGDFLYSISGSGRVRHYCNVVVLWAWLGQILEANASLSKAVSVVQAWCNHLGLPVPGADTGAYSKARSRLSIEFLAAVGQRIRSWLNNGVREEDKWRGYVIKSIDGSSIQLDDTEKNQELYPQSSSQKPGCGFPVMAVMAVLNHAHGGWEGHAVAKQNTHDAALAHEVLDCFGEGDLACADRAFCSFELIGLLKARGAQSLMRLHQARHRVLDLRKGKRLGKNQRLVEWTKARKQYSNSTISTEEWNALPETLSIRLIAFNYRDRTGRKRRMVLATTLLDVQKYPAEELAAIYASRWDIELRLRDVKTTLQMERFRVKTPEMAAKTLEMVMISYNLIKATCRKAANENTQDWRKISFKGALDTIIAYSALYLGRQKHVHVVIKLMSEMSSAIAAKVINPRPGRSEPRAAKRRPKTYSFLSRPRAEYNEIPHRGKHRSFA